MSSSSITRVAFTFLNDGKEWHGGLNYFRSLFIALSSTPGARIAPVAFVGARSDPTRMGFPESVCVVRDPVLDRASFKWFLDKVGMRAFGVSWLTNRMIRRHGINVLSHAGPTGSRLLKNIVWIPDFQHMHLPQFFPDNELRARTALYRDMVSRSDRIVLSSESALQDLESFSPDHVGKARVLRFCAMRPKVNAYETLDLLQAYGIEGPYFYIPNQLWAHKNHLTAVRALARIAAEHPKSSIVCSGALDDYRNPDHHTHLRAEIARHGLERQFRLLGVIPYAHIAQLMVQAEAVINPSLFEGWSTTVEEAKALGVPLLLSDIGVHREQCPNGEADFFPPLDDASLAALIGARLESPRRRMTAVDHETAALRHALRVERFAQDFARIVSELRAEHAG